MNPSSHRHSDNRVSSPSNRGDSQLQLEMSKGTQLNVTTSPPTPARARTELCTMDVTLATHGWSSRSTNRIVSSWSRYGALFAASTGSGSTATVGHLRIARKHLRELAHRMKMLIVTFPLISQDFPLPQRALFCQGSKLFVFCRNSAHRRRLKGTAFLNSERNRMQLRLIPHPFSS